MKEKLSYYLMTVFVCLSFWVSAFPPSCNGLGDSTKGWRPLFNGKDLVGWKHVGDGNMTVEDGLIKNHGGMGLLYWTGEKFGNCTIKVVYRMEKENSNAGFFIRIPI